MERSNNQPTPMVVDTLVKTAKGGVKTVACGQSHSLAIDVEGNLHAWGAGKNGQLGTSRSVPYEPLPKMVSFKYALDQVACGDQHSAAIDDRGRVFTWGLGDAGQLGHGFDKPPAGYPLAEPYQVVGLPQHLGRMVQISCGSQFTAVVSQRGEVYVWGFGEHLYSTIEENFAYEPEKIQLPKKVLEVGCGRGHIVARTEEQNVYCWGACDNGQLGHGRKFPTSTPRLVLEGKNIVEVAAGRYHTTALNIYGVLYSWGCGESGQLGHSDDENALLPKVNEYLLRTVVGNVSCGEHHTAAVCSARLQDIDAQMKKWLDNENEEYDLKQDAAETCPTGLGPKELSALVTERDALRLAKSLREEKKEMKLEREVKGEFEEVPDQEGIRQSILQGIEARSSADRPDSRGSNLTGLSEESAPERLPDVHVKKPKKGKKRRGGGASAMQDVGDSGGGYGEDDDESGLRFDSSIFTAGFEDIGDETAASGGRMDETFFDMMHQATKKGSKWMAEQDRRGSSLVRNATVMRGSFRKDGTELMKQVKQSISVGDMDMDQWEMEKAYQTLLSLKETYDLTRNGANAKEDQLMAMLTELRALEASTQSFDGYVAEQAMKVKMLRQAFSTVKLNWQEALENKHNYEDILSQLKYEGRMQQMELNRVKRLNQDQTKHVMKATKLKDNAEIQEELALVEREEFEKDVHKTKVTFEAYEHHFNTLGQTIQLSRERAEQYAVARQRKNADFSSKAEKKMRKKYKFMEDAMRDQEAKREMADETRLQLEEKYNKLINATNLNDPSDIIDKFYHMEQVHAGLKMQIETNERRTLDLETERQTLQVRGRLTACCLLRAPCSLLLAPCCCLVPLLTVRSNTLLAGRAREARHNNLRPRTVERHRPEAHGPHRKAQAAQGEGVEAAAEEDGPGDLLSGYLCAGAAARRLAVVTRGHAGRCTELGGRDAEPGPRGKGTGGGAAHGRGYGAFVFCLLFVPSLATKIHMLD